MLGYKVEGNGPPLLLIHGWGLSYSIWKNLAPLLRRRFKLIIVELPGINDSPWSDPELPYQEGAADAIEEVRCALKIERWAVLSYSVGTRVGEAYLRKYFHHVDRAVFLCPMQVSTFWAQSLRFGNWVNDHYPSTIDWVVSGWRLKRLVQLMGFNGQRHPYVREWTREIESQRKDVIATTLLSVPSYGLEPFEASNVPTLFVWGQHDIIAARPRKLGAHDRVIAANHSAPMSSAEAVADAIIPFLKHRVLGETTVLSRSADAFDSRQVRPAPV